MVKLKKSTKIVLITGGMVIILFCIFNRSTSPEQKLCESQGGSLKQFSNGCVDSCDYQRNPEEIMCVQVLTYGCECGPDKCWEENQCINVNIV